jgi:hypothetical protein
MSPQPHEGPAEEGLSDSLLRLVADSDRLDQLRRLLSGFSHRYRNSLNGLKIALYLCRRDPAGPLPACWAELDRTYQELESLFDRLQAIYRPMSLTMVRCPLGQLIAGRLESWRSWFRADGRSLCINGPVNDSPGDFDPMHLGMGLDAFAAWRAAAGDVGCDSLLGWQARQGWFEVWWNEVRSAEGTDPRQCTDMDSSRKDRATSSDLLALPLLARIVHAHDGRLESTSAPGFGIKLCWPQFHQGESEPRATKLDDGRSTA